jgi:hypothetical protein
MERLEKEVDIAVCLAVPEDFYAVGQFYQRFDQTEDCEVVKILRENNKKQGNKNILFPKQYHKKGGTVFMKKVIALEEGLSNSIKAALEKEGYSVVKTGTAGKVDATIVTGLDDNVTGMQDITGKAVVIEAAGKTAGEILEDLKDRL